MKIWAYIILAGIIIAAVGGVLRWTWSSGWNARDQQVQQEIIDAQEKARKEEAKIWEETVAKAEATIVVEELIVEKIRVVEKEIPRVVEKIVTVTPECADLGPDYAGLLNDQIRAANGVQGPKAPTGVVEGVL